MQNLNVESIYREIALLSDTDREIVAYTTNGEPLTGEQYRQRINAGIEQCRKGESISLEDLSKELGYNYADL
jgi:hypothetical protein